MTLIHFVSAPAAPRPALSLDDRVAKLTIEWSWKRDGFTADERTRVLSAWRHLINSGAVWTLDGRFGREAARLINKGAVADVRAAA